MERWASARFQVIRINRWSLAAGLMVVLALFLLPVGDLLPVIGNAEKRVKEGVTILDQDFSGMTEEQARVVLSQMAPRLQAAAVAARPVQGADGLSYVVPEVDGYTLDVEATWLRLASASPNSRVEPATRLHKPIKGQSDFPQSFIRQGNPDKKAVSLLINVDWGTNELRQMLPVMKRRGVKATFFVSGKWADGHKHLLQQMAADGHEIATHGYNLAYGPKELARNGKLRDDIAKSVESIRSATGLPVKYYAPHMSEVDESILKTASDLGLRTVLYSLDTVDWSDQTSADMILERMGKAVEGDLILLHPKPNTARVLEKALQNLQGKGLRLLTLSDMLSSEPARPAPAGADR